MKTVANPFLTNTYINKAYFCDREKELELLWRNMENGINTTLISPRRMGKTGLIFRFFEDIEQQKHVPTLYIDIYATRSLNEFINVLTDAVLKRFPEKTSIGKRFMKLLKGFRPVFTFDIHTGSPQVQFLFVSENDKETTLQTLLRFIDAQGTDVVVALDEFQQIANYPEQNVEALLRTCIQQLHHVHFIFSGSRKHTLLEMFTSAKRPFYSSTQFLSLERIDKSIYKQFIATKFQEAGKSLPDDCVDYMLEWTKAYTFYTQSVCNRMFTLKKPDLAKVRNECWLMLKENEQVYFQYRQLLTAKQWNFLIALAKEEEVSEIYASAFLKKYALGTPSGLQRVVKSLLEKEMILEQTSKEFTKYFIYDIFLMRWIQAIYCK